MTHRTQRRDELKRLQTIARKHVTQRATAEEARDLKPSSAALDAAIAGLYSTIIVLASTHHVQCSDVIDELQRRLSGAIAPRPKETKTK